MKDLCKTNVNKKLIFNLTTHEDRAKLAQELFRSGFFPHIKESEWPYLLERRATQFGITGSLHLSDILDKLKHCSGKYTAFKQHLINLGVL